MISASNKRIRYHQWLCLVACFLMLSSPLMAATNRIAFYLQQVRTFFQKGEALVEQKQYKEALFFFNESLRWVRKAKTATSNPSVLQRLRWSEGAFLYILGRTLQQAKQYTRARTHYRQSLALEPRPKVRHQVMKQLRLLARLPGTLVLDSIPPQSRALMTHPTGVRAAKTPLTQKLTPGLWSIQLRKKGFDTKIVKVLIHPHQRHFLLVRMVKKGTGIAQRSPQRSPWKQPLGWTATLVGGAAIAAGVGMLAFARIEAGELARIKGTEKAGSTDAINQRKDRAVGMQWGAVISMVTGLGLGSLGIALLRSPAATPHPGPDAPPARGGTMSFYLLTLR